MLGFGEPGLQRFEIAARRSDIRAVFVVFQTNEHLAGFDLVSNIHTDPCDFADHFRGEFDLMSGNDITRCIENHIAFAAGKRRSRMNAHNVNFNGRIETAIDEALGTQHDEQQDAADNPPRGPS